MGALVVLMHARVLGQGLRNSKVGNVRGQRALQQCCCSVSNLCPTLFDPMDCGPLGIKSWLCWIPRMGD